MPKPKKTKKQHKPKPGRAAKQLAQVKKAKKPVKAKPVRKQRISKSKTRRGGRRQQEEEE